MKLTTAKTSKRNFNLSVPFKASIGAVALLVISLLQTGPTAPVTAEEEVIDRTPLDTSALDYLAVLHNGRLKPLDSLAREAVSVICDRTRPELSLVEAVSPAELDSEELAPARSLFAGEDPRRFEPLELLLSWTFEPEKWEDVPFLIAEHDDLRTEYLEVPVVHEKTGEHLRYVSPRQVREAVKLHERWAELGRESATVRAAGDQFQPVGVDAKIEDLMSAYNLFRQLSFNPQQVRTLPVAQDMKVRSRLLEKTMATIQARDQLLDGLHKQWAELAPEMQQALGLGESDPLQTGLAALRDQLTKASTTPAEIEPSVEQVVSATAELSKKLGDKQRELSGTKPEQFSEEQYNRLRSLLRRLASDSETLAQNARELRLAAYEEDNSLRVVPSLNVAALERNRKPTDDAQPWIALTTIVYGSDAALAGYPPAQIKHVRDAFEQTRQSYLAWQVEPTAEHAESFGTASQDLATAINELGVAVEPTRQSLAFHERDDAMLAYTAYPRTGAMNIEVAYNTIDPFKWSWIISLGAFICFMLAFGVMRKPMFWAGMTLLIAGILWTATGFAMRVYITRWAPVTNMYETVIYVPFVVTVLGIWFTLLPMIWPGVKSAWRLTGLPAGVTSTLGAVLPFVRNVEDSNPPDDWPVARASGAWQTVNLLSLVARAGLTVVTFYILAVAPYGSGGGPVLNLKPNVAVGTSMPTANDLVTWSVGLVVLAVSVWFLPRVVLAGVFTPATIPLANRGRWSERAAEIYPRWPFALAGAFVGFVSTYVAWWAPIPGKNIGPLQPILRDNFWLTIHVLTIVSSYAAGALAWGLGNLSLLYYLFGKYRDPVQVSAHSSDPPHRPATAAVSAERLPKRPPEQCAPLANYTYKTIQVAVLLLVAGTILGGLWADESWGRFWGWDPKEVWALISGLVYLAILHGRYAGWVGNFGLAVGAILGASAILFSWYGVNFVLGVGLHSYGFGTGGQREVASLLVANWILVAAATARYRHECKSAGDGEEVESEPVEASV